MIGTVKRIWICQLCRRSVFKLRTGEWYHTRNGSIACRPGDNSDRKATPLQIDARA